MIHEQWNNVNNKLNKVQRSHNVCFHANYLLCTRRKSRSRCLTTILGNSPFLAQTRSAFICRLNSWDYHELSFTTRSSNPYHVQNCKQRSWSGYGTTWILYYTLTYTINPHISMCLNIYFPERKSSLPF